MYLAERFGFSLRVGWRPTPACEAEFHDLFENDFDLFTSPESNRRAFYKDMLEGPVHYYGKSAVRDPSLAPVASIPKRERNIRRDGHIVYLSPTFLDFIKPPERARHLRGLRVKREILERVETFCRRQGIGKRTYGVHMRRTDAAKRDDDFYIAQIEAILSRNPSAQFFLCSDSAEAEEQMALRFPGRLITKPKTSYVQKRFAAKEWVTLLPNKTKAYNVRRDAQSVVEALEDILILARTNFPIPSGGAFSEVAALWGRGAPRPDLSSTRLWFPSGWARDSVGGEAGPAAAPRHHTIVRIRKCLPSARSWGTVIENSATI